MPIAGIAQGLGIGGGSAATISGSPGGNVPFLNTFSVLLDGTDDGLTMSSTPVYATQSAAFSVSWWMRPVSYGSNGTYANVFALKSDFGTHANFAVHLNNNTSGYAGISFGLTDFSTNTAYWHTTGVTGNTLLNTWSHVVITYNGDALGTIGNWKIYINGASKTIGVGGGWGTSGADENVIGRYRTYYYDGAIDELAVFASELSASNVSTFYNGGNGATDLTDFNPSAWWRMGDGTGDTDNSGGAPENGDATGTVVDQRPLGDKNNATGTGGTLYSTSTP
ncbi:MAG: hypothetical protein CMI15_16300 [Opitutaceae bacterium]|nr:hypothetical protein [Opitutaceae bacterium]|tara:strand:+ start:2593 stop:3432 length:840 start_codon:yes stop_codon:yes gene_type:complete